MSAVLILVSALTVPAWGSIPKKKNNAPAPTYPAVDIDAGSVADSMDDRGSDAGTPAPSDSGVTAPEGPASVPAPMAETVITRPSFDPVPENQREPIARRLKLVNALIEKYGRAYDYRVHTARELQDILNQLDASNSRKLPPPQLDDDRSSGDQNT